MTFQKEWAKHVTIQNDVLIIREKPVSSTEFQTQQSGVYWRVFPFFLDCKAS